MGLEGIAGSGALPLSRLCPVQAKKACTHLPCSLVVCVGGWCLRKRTEVCWEGERLVSAKGD